MNGNRCPVNLILCYTSLVLLSFSWPSPCSWHRENQYTNESCPQYALLLESMPAGGQQVTVTDTHCAGVKLGYSRLSYVLCVVCQETEGCVVCQGLVIRPDWVNKFSQVTSEVASTSCRPGEKVANNMQITFLGRLPQHTTHTVLPLRIHYFMVSYQIDIGL